MSTLTALVADSISVTRRNLVKISRIPELLVPVVVSPLIIVLLFANVLGSAIDVGDGSYRGFVVVGAFVMTLVLGGTVTAVGLAEDTQRGITDRFRSLPMSRAAVVIARTTSDLTFNVISIAVMAVAGLIVGWRIHTGFAEAVVGFGLLLFFAYSFSWIMAYIGLMIPKAEVVGSVGSMVIFPMSFIANTFVPSDGLPTLLRTFAEWNPISAVTLAVREQFGNVATGLPEPTAWSLEHPVAYTLIWALTFILVFAPLTVRQYHKIGMNR